MDLLNGAAPRPELDNANLWRAAKLWREGRDTRGIAAKLPGVIREAAVYNCLGIIKEMAASLDQAVREEG